MTRKDYQAFATMFAECRPHTAEARAIWNHIVTEAGAIFAADNPRFGFIRFYEACGVKARDGRAA